MDHFPDTPLRKLMGNPGEVSGGTRTSDLRSEKISDAALATQEAIAKATMRGRCAGA